MNEALNTREIQLTKSKPSLPRAQISTTLFNLNQLVHKSMKNGRKPRFSGAKKYPLQPFSFTCWRSIAKVTLLYLGPLEMGGDCHHVSVSPSTAFKAG